MTRVPYFLVCHATQTKVYIGYGYHSLEVGMIDAQALTDFLAENIIHTLVIEWGREDLKEFREYTSDVDNNAVETP